MLEEACLRQRRPSIREGHREDTSSCPAECMGDIVRLLGSGS